MEKSLDKEQIDEEEIDTNTKNVVEELKSLDMIDSSEVIVKGAQKEKLSVRKMLLGLAYARKGHEFLAQSAKHIHQAIAEATCPMENLDQLVKVTAKVRAYKYPQTYHAELKDPKKIPERVIVDKSSTKCKFKCRQCGDLFGSWTGCDAHIRRQHTGQTYGPCPCTKEYETHNLDLYKRHLKKCAPKSDTAKGQNGVIACAQVVPN